MDDEIKRRMEALINWPLKRDRVIERYIDEDGKERIYLDDSLEMVIQPDGAQEKLKDDQIKLFDCGHSRKGRSYGGRCFFCGGIICDQCYALCQKCGVGACPLHYVKEEDGTILCLECHKSYKRKKIFGAVGKFVLSPFVEWESEQEEKDE